MKLFKSKRQVEPQEDYEYWKDLRLDNEGTYDYLVEELPTDTQKWQWWYEKCDSCSKYHRRNFVSTHYFYTLDGYDSMSYTECWKCMLTSKVRSWWLKRRREKEKQQEFKHIVKSMNITKEDAATIKKILYNK